MVQLRGRIDGSDLDLVVTLLCIDADCIQVSLTLAVLGRGYFDFIPVPASDRNRPIRVIDGEFAAIGERIVEFFGLADSFSQEPQRKAEQGQEERRKNGSVWHINSLFLQQHGRRGKSWQQFSRCRILMESFA